MKKQKCAQSSKGSSELIKHLKDKEEETDENAPTSKCDWHNRSHRRSVAMASEVEEVGINNNIIKLLSVNTRHGSKSECYELTPPVHFWTDDWDCRPIAIRLLRPIGLPYLSLEALCPGIV